MKLQANALKVARIKQYNKRNCWWSIATKKRFYFLVYQASTNCILCHKSKSSCFCEQIKSVASNKQLQAAGQTMAAPVCSTLNADRWLLTRVPSHLDRERKRNGCEVKSWLDWNWRFKDHSNLWPRTMLALR